MSKSVTFGYYHLMENNPTVCQMVHVPSFGTPTPSEPACVVNSMSTFTSGTVRLYNTKKMMLHVGADFSHVQAFLHWLADDVRAHPHLHSLWFHCFDKHCRILTSSTCEVLKAFSGLGCMPESCGISQKGLGVNTPETNPSPNNTCKFVNIPAFSPLGGGNP